MKSPFRLLVALLSLVSALAVHAATSDDMQIYSDRFNNMSESN
jgi:Spy/CpxP family protein refolding chaperone